MDMLAHLPVSVRVWHNMISVAVRVNNAPQSALRLQGTVRTRLLCCMCLLICAKEVSKTLFCSYAVHYQGSYSGDMHMSWRIPASLTSRRRFFDFTGAQESPWLPCSRTSQVKELFQSIHCWSPVECTDLCIRVWLTYGQKRICQQ